MLNPPNRVPVALQNTISRNKLSSPYRNSAPYPPHHMLQYQEISLRLHPKIISRQSISAPIHLQAYFGVSGVGRGGGETLGPKRANFIRCGAYMSPGKGKVGRRGRGTKRPWQDYSRKVNENVLQQLAVIPVISSTHAYRSSTLSSVISLNAGGYG
ncbi:hypothetical protein B0H34DRAFT_180956 [Crassisporium funariophilum]|nr:hypothetical protein B0H34DRAFT_180956 [Crassisporium funariophilum]